MTALFRDHCHEQAPGTPTLTKADVQHFLKQVKGWRPGRRGQQLEQEFQMKDFVSAVALITQITHVAQAQNHHPDLHLTNYRQLRIVLSTHSIGGLSRNDFILAAQIDRLPKKLKRF